LGVKDMSPRKSSVLVALLLLYAVASFLHFAHNAELLSDYPNLPSWLTRAGVLLGVYAAAAALLVTVVLAFVKRTIPQGGR
jgi:hypothetical protein